MTSDEGRRVSSDPRDDLREPASSQPLCDEASGRGPSPTKWVYDYWPENVDPGFALWMAWAQDVYDEDKERGMDMLTGYVATVMVKARRG